MKKTLCFLLVLCMLFAALPSLAGNGPVTVTDAAGREVTLSGSPERIVSGYYISTSLLIALGKADKLVGIEAKANTRPIYALSAPELLNLPSVGTAKQLDLEVVLSLEPDLIILPMKQAETAESLREMGYTAIVVNPESREELLDTIRLLAVACGADSAPLEDFYTFAVEKLNTLLSGVEPVRTYIACGELLRTSGNGMYQDTMLTLGGAENVAHEIESKSWISVDYEQLLLWNPEAIIIAPQTDCAPSDVLSDSALQTVDAVANSRVYRMPEQPECWDSPVAGCILGSLWAASVLYPDVYSNEAFLEDSGLFYRTFFGFELTGEMLQ